MLRYPRDATACAYFIYAVHTFDDEPWERNVADKKDMKTYLAKIAQLEAQLALKIDKPSTLPFAEPLFSSCSKDGANCAPAVEASGK